MIQTFLIPTDFSKTSEKATASLVRFVEKIQAASRILMLHTYLVPAAPPDKVILTNDSIKKKSLAGLNRQLELAKKIAPHTRISFETLSHMGSLINVLGHVVDQLKSECIVTLPRKGLLKEDELKHLMSGLLCPLLFLKMTD